MAPAYEIKGIKNFKGHEGEPCSQGSLYHGAKKVAEWSDSSTGGPITVRFSSDAEQKAFLPFAREYLSGMPDVLGTAYDLDKMNIYGITEEAIERMSYAAGELAMMTKLTKDHKLVVTVPAKWEGGEPGIVSINCLYTVSEVARIKKEMPEIIEVVNARFGAPLKEGSAAHVAAEAKLYASKCKTQTIYVRRIDGQDTVWFLKRLFNPAVAKLLREKYPDLVRIVNEGAAK
jgi:hypothetical protein